jgi:acyl carrier protein
MSEKLKEIMSKVLDLSVSQIADDTSPDTVDGWDSIKSINLVIALEEEFDIEFSDEQLESMLNFKLIQLAIDEAVASAG